MNYVIDIQQKAFRKQADMQFRKRESNNKRRGLLDWLYR